MDRTYRVHGKGSHDKQQHLLVENVTRILERCVMLPIKWGVPHGNQRVLLLVLWNGFMGERFALFQTLLLRE